MIQPAPSFDTYFVDRCLSEVKFFDGWARAAGQVGVVVVDFGQRFTRQVMLQGARSAQTIAKVGPQRSADVVANVVHTQQQPERPIG